MNTEAPGHPRKLTSRRQFLASGTLTPLGLLFPTRGLLAGPQLDLYHTFKGTDQFQKISNKAISKHWHKLPIGERIMVFAREMHGTPYVGFTLEIHDRIESPSVNLRGLDCWTFFETALGMARMVELQKPSYHPNDLLREIEWTRYRGGTCNGNYLDRIHYLAEWFFEAEARGIATDITRELGHSQRLSDRKIQEMTVLWKSYRYLKNNPSLRKPMAVHESRVARLPVDYIPREKVHLVEPKLQNGDILGIVTRHDGGFCSHVGLLSKGKDGVARLMHASRNYKKVVVDKSISAYLKSFSSHLGVMVARPRPRSEAIVNQSSYEKNLRKLTGLRKVGP